MAMFTVEKMENVLDQFGKKYEYPVYGNLIDLTGFFASNRNVRIAFAGLTEYSILVSYTSLLGTLADSYTNVEIQKFSITSIKITKSLIGNTHTIDIKGAVGKNKYRYKLMFAEKVSGGEFPDQFYNKGGFISTLQQWEKEIG